MTPLAWTALAVAAVAIAAAALLGAILRARTSPEGAERLRRLALGGAEVGPPALDDWFGE